MPQMSRLPSPASPVRYTPISGVMGDSLFPLPYFGTVLHALRLPFQGPTATMRPRQFRNGSLNADQFQSSRVSSVRVIWTTVSRTTSVGASFIRNLPLVFSLKPRLARDVSSCSIAYFSKIGAHFISTMARTMP